jgi:SNF2 family DNA or RNA helicase
MGLGKTVMMLALITSNPKVRKKSSPRAKKLKKSSKVSKNFLKMSIEPKRSAGTLVVLPVSLLS